jgi:opacity protein-like surface antigen
MSAQKFKLLPIAILVLSSATALSAAAPVVKNDAGFYMGVGANFNALGVSSFRVQEGRESIIYTENEKVHSGRAGYNFFAGYRFSRYFGLELGYQQFGTLRINSSSLSTFSSNKREATSYQRVKFLNLNALAYWPLTSHLSPFVRLGGGYYHEAIKMRASLNGVIDRGTSESLSGWNINYGLGLQFNATQHLAFRGALNYARFSNPSGIGSNNFGITGNAIGVNPNTKFERYWTLDALYQFTGKPIHFTSAPDNHGWFVGLGLNMLSSINFSDHKYHDTTTFHSDKLASTKLGYNLFAGYQFNKYFALQGEYQSIGQAKIVRSQESRGTTTTFTNKLDQQYFNIQGLAFLPVSKYFSPYVILGAGYYHSTNKQINTSSSNSPFFTAEDLKQRVSGALYNYGFGLQFNPLQQLSLRLSILQQEFFHQAFTRLVNHQVSARYVSFDALYRFYNAGGLVAKVPEQHGWFVGLGLNRLSAFDFKTRNFGQSESTSNTATNTYKSTQSPAGLNLLAGYQYNKYFALQGEYHGFGTLKAERIVTGGLSRTTKYKTTNGLVDVQAMGFLPLTKWFSPFLSVGAGYQDVTVKSNAPGVSGGLFSAAGTADKSNYKLFSILYGMGLEFRPMNALAIRASYNIMKYSVSNSYGFSSSLPNSWVSLDVVYRMMNDGSALPKSWPKRHGVYVGLGVNRNGLLSFNSSDDLSFTGGSSDINTVTTKVNNPGYNLFVGYQVNAFLAGQLSYQYFGKSVIKTTNYQSGGEASYYASQVTFRSSLASANVLLMLPVTHYFSPYVQLGLGFSILSHKQKATAGASFSENSHHVRGTFNYGLGLEFDPSQHIALRLSANRISEDSNSSMNTSSTNPLVEGLANFDVLYRF